MRLEIKNTRWRRRSCAGLTLTEMIVVILIVSLMVTVVQMNLVGMLRNSTFRGQVQGLVATMQAAASAAAQSDRRYEIIINIEEQSYTLREITSAQLDRDAEEGIITQKEFNENCWIDYVEFDDGEYANENRAWFWVGHSGWQYGGKIVLLDESDRPYSVVVNRINRTIVLKRGDVKLLKPKDKEDVWY